MLRVALFSDAGIVRFVSKPAKFEHYRYVGDKRNQRVYDLDMYGNDERVTAKVDALLDAETFAAFSPDTLVEARNRGYRPDRSIKPDDEE
jgi:hypothetical protein